MVESGSSKKSATKRSTSASAKKTTENTGLSGSGCESELQVGNKAPTFSLLDQNGDTVTSRSLKGLPYVLYFYPKDNTPGCTTEACEFRDAASQFDKLGVRIIGVSPDPAATHGRFAAKHNLEFTLLSDPEHELSNAYGTWTLKKNYGREYMGIVRSTFVVGPTGKLEHIWRKVRVKGHVEAVRLAVSVD